MRQCMINIRSFNVADCEWKYASPRKPLITRLHPSCSQEPTNKQKSKKTTLSSSNISRTRSNTYKLTTINRTCYNFSQYAHEEEYTAYFMQAYTTAPHKLYFSFRVIYPSIRTPSTSLCKTSQIMQFPNEQFPILLLATSSFFFKQ